MYISHVKYWIVIYSKVNYFIDCIFYTTYYCSKTCLILRPSTFCTKNFSVLTIIACQVLVGLCNLWDQNIMPDLSTVKWEFQHDCFLPTSCINSDQEDWIEIVLAPKCNILPRNWSLWMLYHNLFRNRRICPKKLFIFFF